MARRRLRSLQLGAATSNKITSTAATANVHTYSIAMWVYPTTLTDLRCLFTVGGNPEKLVMLTGTAGALQFELAATTLAQQSTGTAFIQANQWCFVGISCNASSIAAPFTAYKGRIAIPCAVDTLSTGSVGAGTPTAEISADTAIGGNSALTTRAFQGRIAYFARYNRVLSIGEFREIQLSQATLTGCNILLRPGMNGVSLRDEATSRIWTNTGGLPNSSFNPEPSIRCMRARPLSMEPPASGSVTTTPMHYFRRRRAA